jgi:hypothetical protein
MKLAIIITIIILIIYYLNKKSANNHFFKNSRKLDKDFLLIYDILSSFDFPKDYIQRFALAYNFFRENPSQYNGTSIINDRYTIGGLEVQSVVHAYDWIVATSLKALMASNVRYAKSLRKMNSNWIWVWAVIFPALTISAILTSFKFLFYGTTTKRNN